MAAGWSDVNKEIEKLVSSVEEDTLWFRVDALLDDEELKKMLMDLNEDTVQFGLDEKVGHEELEKLLSTCEEDAIQCGQDKEVRNEQLYENDKGDRSIGALDTSSRKPIN